jgi:hypothetical protein
MHCCADGGSNYACPELLSADTVLSRKFWSITCMICCFCCSSSQREQSMDNFHMQNQYLTCTQWLFEEGSMDGNILGRSDPQSTHSDDVWRGLVAVRELKPVWMHGQGADLTTKTGSHFYLQFASGGRSCAVVTILAVTRKGSWVTCTRKQVQGGQSKLHCHQRGML